MISSESAPVELLKYPYPYQAAFAVASDIDSGSLLRFRAVHALFCSRDVIKENSAEWDALGLKTSFRRFEKQDGGIRGLGFDCSDSFFLIGDSTTFGMYRYEPETGQFREDEQEGQNCADVVREWFVQGKIEAFHTFLHYTRIQVEPLLRGFYEWCERENVNKPRIWINHSAAVTPSGICPDRLQPGRGYRLARLALRYLVGPKFGRKRHPLHYAFVRYWGDSPDSPYYINDILAANGLRYVWLNMDDDAYEDRICLPETQQNGRSTILKPVTMDDGVRYWRFERCYGGPPGRRRGEVYLRDSDEGFDSSYLINEKNLDELWKTGGTCIFHTHWTHFRSLPLSEQTIGRFELLRRWHDAGKIWVTRTSRLLEWTRLRTFLKMEVRREGKKLVIDVVGLDDPIFGVQKLTAKDLAGVCFRLPDNQTRFVLAINGKPSDPENIGYSGDLCWFMGTPGNGVDHPDVPSAHSIRK